MSSAGDQTRLTSSDAVTTPMQTPAVPDTAAIRRTAGGTSGTVGSTDATIPMAPDLGTSSHDAATITTPQPGGDQTLPVADFGGEQPTRLTNQHAVTSATNPTLIADPHAATRPSTDGAYKPDSVAPSSSTDATRVTSASSFDQAKPPSTSFTNTSTRRRTRINDKLPADTQALDVKLQLSRVSVFADMVARAQGKLTAKFRKLVDDHGTHGRYIVNRPLAQGGMGAVLEIKDGDFQRRAAMKIILPRYAGTPETLERFLAEAQVTAQLEHPNIVPIHDLGVMEDGSLYFTMKFIEGTSLGGVVKKLKENDPAFCATWTLDHILLSFLKVLDGVGFANSKGVIHRDIKPDNIMIGAHGEVLVVDWGIAKVLGDADPSSELVRQVQSVRDQDNFSATMAGHAIGTIYYMPPEQAEGRLADVDQRSDVYALGATLYELITLKRPVESGQLKEMLERVAGGILIPALTAKPDLHPDLAAIIMRSMSWRREDRYQTCGDFAADLQRFLSGQAVAARKRSVAELLKAWYQQHRTQVLASTAGIVLLVGGISGTLAFMHHQKASQAAALRDQAQHDLEAKDIAAADKAIGRSLDLIEVPGAIALQGEIRQQLGKFEADREAENKRQASNKKALELLASARATFAIGKEADLLDVDKQLAAALALANLPEITEFRKEVLLKLTDKLRKEREQRAADNKAKGDRLLDAAAALNLDDPKLDQTLKDAEFAFKDAIAEAASPPRIDESRARLMTMTSVITQRRDEQTRRRTADDAIAKAKSARSIGKLDEARSQIERALDAVPGDKVSDALRLDIMQAQANAEQERIRAANRVRAAAAYTDAVIKNQARREALAELNRQKTNLAALEISASQDRSAVFTARGKIVSATQQVVENWAKTEQACATVVNGLDGDRDYAIPDGTVLWTAARRILADVYWVRLQAARESGALAEIAAFTNLLSRVADESDQEKLKGDATVTITGAGPATIRLLSIGNDGRFQPVGSSESVTLPLTERRLPSGRYRLTVGTWHADLYLAPTATAHWTVPATPPTIADHELIAVIAPPNGKSFALGATEITHQQYYEFITDKKIWPQVQASWKANVLEPVGTAGSGKPLSLLPRSGFSAESVTWQPHNVNENLDGFSFPNGLESCAVSGVTRTDAEAYCAWLSAKSGAKVRLPTRLEWQWAATAGDPKRLYPWGDQFDRSFTVCALAFAAGKADAQKPGSNLADIGPFGHLDLAGNIREWLSDRPTANDSLVWHGALIAGGGYFDASPDQFRSTFVETLAPETPNGQIGFRILVEIP